MDNAHVTFYPLLTPFTLALCAAAICAGTSASAQAPDSAQRRDTTRRNLTRRDTAAVMLAPVAVREFIAPTAGPAIGSAVPAPITVVFRREIDAWEPRTVVDALATKAGVSLYDDLGSPYKLNLSTRGFTVGPTIGVPPGVSVFLDGIRQNEPDAQEVNFDLLPMEHVERVELLSGTASLLGPNSLGGAVNLVTRRGTGVPGGELEISRGSFGAASGEASFRGASRGADYYAGGGYARERGWREGTAARNYNGFVNLGHRDASRGLRLQAFGARSRAETAGSLPESVFRVSPGANFTTGDFEDLDAEQLALSGYAPVGRGRGSFTTFLRRSGAERFNVNQPPDDNVRSRTTNRSLGASADWRWATAMSGRTVAFRAGVDGAAKRVRVRIFAEPQGGAAGTAAADGGDSLTTDVGSPSWDLAGYAIADVRWARVTVSAGARYDYVRVPFRDLLDPGADSTNSFRRLNPRGGVSVDLGSGGSVYASAGQSFRAPAILELGCADPDAACPLPFALGDDPPLRPVRATTYEVGGRWTGGPVLLSASLYRTEVRDEIFFVASEWALLSGYFTNIARTRRTGAEFDAQFSAFDDRVSAYANYSDARASFQTNVGLFSIRANKDFAASPLAGPNAVEPGDHIPLVPARQVKAGVLARLPTGQSFGVELGFDARYVGRQWLRGDEANETRPLDPYVVTNARAGIGRGTWKLTLLVTNLLDSHRATFGTFNENRRTGEMERFLTPLTARTLKLVVRRGFGAGGRDDRD